ncbi:DEK domain-containing chromatin-associated protein 1-like isoform X2 [Actinidia eriantha]|uniref:DEK domain-containing chromatin-associated protein 1-like isoform X2 n=1 Tax=Actinidia eriantha TaxID=165200 RepID=UPI002582EB20|nr:DEK domain-containing chromatin-associated protein 1-like isoform X2 [Actinidia eriantha]
MIYQFGFRISISNPAYNFGMNFETPPNRPAFDLFSPQNLSPISAVSPSCHRSLGFFLSLCIYVHTCISVLQGSFRMASETLEERKQEDTASVEDKGELIEEEKEEGGEGEEEREAEEKEGGDTEMVAAEEESEQEKEESKEEGEERKEEGSKKKSKRGKKNVKKAMSEPVTPSERPTRERKTVERYSAPSTGRSASKGFSIEKGQGTQLKDIPNVAFKLSKKKPDDNLQILHTLLYGKRAKPHSLKRNIGQFSGYVWIENEEKQRAKMREKLDKCVKEKLLDFCDVLNIPINKTTVKKEEVSAKLLEFLESPHPTTDTLLADKEQKGKKRKGKATESRTANSGEASGEASVKKRKKIPQVGEKRKRSSKTEDNEVDDKVEPSQTENESQDDGDSDSVPKEESDQERSKSEEEEEEDEPMKQIEKKSSAKKEKEDSGSRASQKSKSVKKDTPAKSVKSPSKSTKKSSSSTPKKFASSADGASGSASKPKVSATKKQKVEEESEKVQSPAKEKVTSKKQLSEAALSGSSKDKGKRKASKKAKPEPSKEEMHAVVVNILKEVDFNTATLSDILRQLGSHFGVDLMHRKAEVKAIITDVINNMSDEEDDEGDEAGSGDDAEKDEDGDDDA